MDAVERPTVDINKTTLTKCNALFSALSNSRWVESRALLDEPNASRSLDHVSSYTGANATHLACITNAPHDVLQRIHNLRPELMEGLNNSGFTPLFVACFQSSDKTVAFLVENAPGTAAKSYWNRLLPIAIHYQRSPFVIQILLGAHPNMDDGYLAELMRIFTYAWKREVESEFVEIEDAEKFKFKATLSVLLEFHARGTEEGPVNTSGGEQLSLVQKAIRQQLTVPIPSKVVRAIVRLANRVGFSRPDERRDFPLHLVCAQVGVVVVQTREP